MRKVVSTAAIAVALSMLAGVPAAWAADWVSVAKSDRVEVFVKTSKLSRTGDIASARTKENYVEAQPSTKKGKTYLSARNDYRIDCAQRKVAYSENRAFAGADLTGEVVQKASATDKNLQWMDAPEGTVFGELLDYVCKNAPVVAAAPAKW
jgi:hypothetical protein